MKKVLSTVMSVLLVGTLFIQQVFLVSAANAQIEVEVDGTKTYFDTIQSAVDSVQNGGDHCAGWNLRRKGHYQ